MSKLLLLAAPVLTTIGFLYFLLQAADVTACKPAVAFTAVPEFGTFADLHGTTACVEPGEHRLAVAIHVGGWWTKPTFVNPLTPIRPDGTWSADITTGGSDQLATAIVAFLVPASYSPPLLSGENELPSELFDSAIAYVHTNRSARTIQFAGRTWHVKSSNHPVGPGPNYFSDAEQDVWVDAEGRLHLTISHRDGVWYTTEVFTQEALGLGEYRFELASRVDLYDPNVVVGLFTWHSVEPAHNYREIDVEFSRWSDVSNDNAQYVVQPYNIPCNIHRFNMALSSDSSTHRFLWSNDHIAFSSHGPQTQSGEEIASWRYSCSSIPPDGAVNARINLWLVFGSAPTDGQDVELIVTDFNFQPLTPTALTNVAGSSPAAPSSGLWLALAFATMLTAFWWRLKRKQLQYRTGRNAMSRQP